MAKMFLQAVTKTEMGNVIAGWLKKGKTGIVVEGPFDGRYDLFAVGNLAKKIEESQPSSVWELVGKNI